MNELQPLTFPLFDSRLIEASAGTGKTYTIAALFVRLVMNHGNAEQAFGRPLQPKDILVMTFTRAATAELADRIRARLSEAASYFRRSEHDSEDEFLRALKVDCGARAESGSGPSLAMLARQLELAAQSMDEAAVSTIHGWCQKMLAEHAFASGSLFEQSIETDEDELKLAAAEDYFRTYVYAHAVEPVADTKDSVITELLELLQSPASLLQKIGHPLPPQAARECSLLEWYQQAMGKAAAQVNVLKQQYAPLADALQTLIQALPDARNGGRKKAVAAFYDWVHGDTLSLIIAAADKKYLSAADLSKQLKDQTPADVARMDGLLEQLQSLNGLAKQAHAEVFAHANQHIYQRVDALKRQAAQMGHDDMLNRLLAALQQPDSGPRLAAAIRAQFPVALVDEFQDTDPVQYEIFERIYLTDAAPDERRGLFLIGDPKQAIYSFRNADIYTYLKARRATTGRHYQLATNFRSSAAMVAAVNALYSRADTQLEQGAFLFKQDIPFVPVGANGKKLEFRGSNGAPQAALQWQVASEKSTSKAAYWQLAARAQAQQIAALLSSESAGFYAHNGERTAVAPSDIAVLVGNANEARVIRQALTAYGIRSVYLSERDAVYAQPVAAQLLSVVQACATPRDPRKLRAALASALLELPLAELVQCHEQEQAWEAAVEQFIGYHQLWERRGILAMLQRLLHDYKVPARLLADPVRGERQLADALHLSELLQQESMRLDGMASLTDFFAEQVQSYQQSNGFGASQQRTNNEALQLRLESDQALVKVITYHKSKGLQYPLVFMPFAGYTAERKYRIDDRLPQRYHNPTTGQTSVLWDTSDSEAVSWLQQQMLAEDIRKMYVALTRAEYATFVALQVVGDTQQNPLFWLLGQPGENLLEQLPSRVHGDEAALGHTDVVPLRIDAEEYPAGVAQPEGNAAEQLQARQLPEHYQLERWWVASYSALRIGTELSAPQTPLEMNTREELETFELGSPAPAVDTAATIHELPKGAGPGTFLHNLLEAAAEYGFAELAANSAGLEQWLAPYCKSPVWQPYQATLAKWLGGYLSTEFPLQNGEQVALAQLRQYRAEPEFWFATQGVDTRALDALICTHIQLGFERPQLETASLNGMLKGFIDLVFEYQGRYYVCDYKSNWLGEDEAAYTEHSMREKILSSRYDLQYVIYTLALHKLLQARLGEAYDYDQHIGGSLYLFLRGHQAPSRGAFFDRPSRELIEALAELMVGVNKDMHA